jgi:glucosamine--fructose-6-phosphate aminotransferase (isomerizing)
MCGIIGAVASRDVTSTLLEGLKRLEYRGYDSAGLTVITSDNQFERLRASGKVKYLQKLFDKHPISGNTGIAHTRWATHGKPSEQNAHPHIAGNEVAIVHNGIIENHQIIRAKLLSYRCDITSETDSELIAHLVYLELNAGNDFFAAVKNLSHEIEGAYAIAIIHRSEPGRMIAIRKSSPLVIGLGTNENYVASDALVLLPLTKRVIYLEDGDIADIYTDKVIVYDVNGNQVQREIHILKDSLAGAEKEKYAHFMLKEIYEQPDAVAKTLEGRLSSRHVLTEAFGIKAPEIFNQTKHVMIVACGTSYHAGLVAKFWIEEIAGISCQVEIASEYRYRQKIVEPDTLFITISQSGETADTLAALRSAKKYNYLATLAICNMPVSSLVRESDLVLMTDAGPEIGVASTKSFTCQLASLIMLSIALGSYKGLDPGTETNLIKLLSSLPRVLEQTLKLDLSIKNIVSDFQNKQDSLFLARGILYPIAKEGALKLKEISYIHAEACPAGELKHGTLALVNPAMPIIVLVPEDDLVKKIKSNLEEIATRGGNVILFADKRVELDYSQARQIIRMPVVERLLAPIVYSIPMQLLAYYVALLKGTDIDQPRNLAKSVTVE